MTSSPQAAIIADDLTGATDTGACFAHHGLVTMLVLRCGFPVPADVLAISTESRHLPEDEAAARVRRAATQIRAAGPLDELTWIYKKIDSTLRGHPGSELAVVMKALDVSRVLVAPAFPAQGRTTVGGRQWVHGVPLELTVFGHEVETSHLRSLFCAGTADVPVRLLELSTVRQGPAAVCQALAPSAGIVVADAETDADLSILAQAATGCHVRLLCGSAGLARALADTLPLTAKAPTPALPRHHGGPVLVVAGSRHPRTTRQVQVAQQGGAAVIRPDQTFLHNADQSGRAAAERVAAHLARGRDVILTTLGLEDSGLGERAVAGWLARVVRALAAENRLGGLVLTGGDIAAAVCAALEAATLWVCGETEPGIAWGVLLDGILPGTPVVTKAGGFGTDGALVSAIHHIRKGLGQSPSPITGKDNEQG